MRRAWAALAAFVLVVLFAVPAGAVNTRSELYDKGFYVATMESPSGGQVFFDGTANSNGLDQGYTSTAADKVPGGVDFWSISNQGGGLCVIQLWTTSAPEGIADYTYLRLKNGESITMEGITLVGWNMTTDPAAASWVTVIGAK